jgi:molybdopterin-containing oxidoreductase family membrane subunit
MNEGNDEELTVSVVRTTRAYYVALAVLLILVSWGLYAYSLQLMTGLGVTGLNTTIFWGLYIASLVYFIGISHAGTLISGILRATNAEWRTPITRLAEAATVFALLIAVPQILFDIGRPDRILHPIVFGRIQSPMIWDFVSILTYFVASCIYLYVAMIPDFPIFLKNTKMPAWKSLLYRLLSINWRGSEEQYVRLHRAIKVMVALVIPLAVSVHTVVSWAFAMTLRPGWHSTIFGPYFVVGAIYSGIGAILIVLWFYRRIFRVEGYIKPEHFSNLGWLLLVLCFALIYMTISQLLTDYYGGLTIDVKLLNSLMAGEWTPLFWSYVVANFILPLSILLFILLRKKAWIVNGTFLVGIIVNVGMFLERYQIVAPTLSVPFLPYPQATYTPTWIEFSILIASISAFPLLYLIFVKVFPPISIWEVKGLGRLPTGFRTGLSRKRDGEPMGLILPHWLLIVVVGAYAVLLYVLSRALIYPTYSSGGLIMPSLTSKLGTVGVLGIVVTVAWLMIGYVVYQLYKISKS